MDQKTFSLIAGIVFAIVALAHLWRITQGWEVTISGTLIPMGASWAALVVAGVLAVCGLRLGLR